MWERRHSTVDWVHFKTQTLLTTLKTRNQPQEESCVSLEAEHLFCKLDVQEARIWLAQFHRVWDNFSRCWTTCGWVTCYWSLGHSDWGTAFNQRHCPTQPYWHRGNSCEAQFQSQDQKKNKRRQNNDQLPDVDYVPANTHILLKVSLSCTLLKTMKLSSKWLSKDGVRRWDMCQEPTELRLIGCSTESIWNPRSKSNMLTP